MPRAVSSILLITFTLWIMPLGIFIKPFLQKMACDGQRAICMCHAFVPKSSGKAMERGINFRAAPGTQKENPSGGNMFVSARSTSGHDVKFNFFFVKNPFFYTNPLSASLEHVPKF
jgi:hypothetical protein